MVYTKIFQRLTLMLPIFFKLFFIHLKLELLTQFPAPNNEKYLCLLKNIRLQTVIIRLTNHPPQNNLAIKVEFIWSEICLKTHTYCK